MSRLFGLAAFGALLLASASRADAQVAVSIGNPYLGNGLYAGGGYGYPGVYAPVVAPIVPRIYAPAPAFYGGYGYRPYGRYGVPFGRRPYGYGPYRRW